MDFLETNKDFEDRKTTPIFGLPASDTIADRRPPEWRRLRTFASWRFPKGKQTE
jgi:hypothetical protein